MAIKGGDPRPLRKNEYSTHYGALTLNGTRPGQGQRTNVWRGVVWKRSHYIRARTGGQDLLGHITDRPIQYLERKGSFYVFTLFSTYLALRDALCNSLSIVIGHMLLLGATKKSQSSIKSNSVPC